MKNSKQTLLFIEDDPNLAEMLISYFDMQGYRTISADWGEDGINIARTAYPDLILLDIQLPDITGYEVAKRLRKDRRTKNIPIIFLTDKAHLGHRLKGLELGADDYITKPFDILELRLRVRNALQRITQGNDVNPITNLKENVSVDTQLERLLRNPNAKSAVLFRIEHLASFQKKQGHDAADDVLRSTGMLIQATLRNSGKTNDFLGHLSNNEFLIITDENTSSNFAENLLQRITLSLDNFDPRNSEGAEANGSTSLAVRYGILSQREIQSSRNMKALKRKLIESID